MFIRIEAVLTVGLLFLSGCATNPMTGRSQFMIVSEKTAVAQATQAYTAMVGGLEQKGRISSDPELNKRVQMITDRLITQAVRFRPDAKDWAWEVKVISDPTVVNAFCMPGGKMAIYTGLIEKIHANDDEIAQVMGHEIGHALANHGAEKMSVQLASNIAVAVIAATGRTQSDQQGRHDAAYLAALAFINLPNSRTEEAEADRMGIELAARAGYDPHAALTLWEKMVKESGDSSRFDFLKTHPAPVKRIEALEALEAPMQKLYEATQSSDVTIRPWTSTPPNVRVIEPSTQDSSGASSLAEQQSTAQPPLVFYSPQFDKFEHGALELTCRNECAMSFFLKQGPLKALNEKQDWRTLATEVINIGYRIDLSYYYLGRAALGLGFSGAAHTYFETANRLSEVKDDSCAAGLLIGCSGINVKEESTRALAAH